MDLKKMNEKNKYYLIHKYCESGSCFSFPAFIVESKEIAEHFCKKGQYHVYYWYEEITIDNHA